VRKAIAKPDNTLDTILRAGQLVDGKYRVDHLLGEGGMAAVWAGTNERTGKRVALKVILRSLATRREAQGLFHSEALAASRVNHPNVVTVFDVIEHEGMACIVMELLDGEPLGSYIARKRFLTVSEATALLLPAMRGVAAAHAQGVIHRDLKPQNIFICVGPDGRIVTTKVLDFGISLMVERVMDPSVGQIPPLAMGTPSYMAPEHLLGGPNIDGRADVYGFGLLLYEALTGQMPFPGEMGPDLFQRILNEPAPRVTLFRPDLPPGLVRIIETAMAKQPDDRYSDLNLMVGALEDELAPPTPPPRLLTPRAGVAALAVHDRPARDSEPVVLAIAKKEPSGPHQATMLYCARPLESGAANGGSNAGSELATPPPPLGRETIRVHRKPSLLRVPFSGARSLFTPRGRRGSAGVGLAVVLAFGVWMAMEGSTEVEAPSPAPVGNAAPPASEPATPPPIPAVAPTVTIFPVEVPAPVVVPPSPPAPRVLATREHSKPSGHARGGSVPIMRSRSRVAVGEGWKDLGPRQQAGRGILRGYESALWPRSAARAGAWAKPALPRAGSLTEDDF
jgi:eukaryotic-like serine/threonine-protein kinase